MPVSDVDRAKAFYLEQMGFTLLVDHSAGEDFRVVQLVPSGSACAIALMRNDAAGSVQGLHLVVQDVDAARDQLLTQGAPVGELFHFGATGQAPGPDPERRSYNTVCAVQDPDGNG